MFKITWENSWILSTVAVISIVLMEITEGNVVEVAKCGSVGQLEKVEVTDCEVLPCTFQRGMDYSINVTFIPRGHSNSLTFNATAKFYGINLPLFGGNACDIIADGQKCPIKDGVVYKLKMMTKLSLYAPPIRKLIVNATITDEFGKIQACASLPARVV